VVQALTPFCKPAAKQAAPPTSPKRETRLGSDTPLEKTSPVDWSEIGEPRREEQGKPSRKRPSSGPGKRWAVPVAAGMALALLLAGIVIVIKWTRKDGSSTEATIAIHDDGVPPLRKSGRLNGDIAVNEKGFVQIFNGKDLTGWIVDGGDANAWQVKDGELVAYGTEDDDVFTQGYLLTERVYSDFVLPFQFRQVGNAGATSGVAFRAKEGEMSRDSAPDPRESNYPFHLTVFLGS
jgi:hypothetical protein